MENIKISTDYIKLDQLLKFANIAENGADAKYLIVNGYVYLNGEKETRRGKKVFANDIVKVEYENDCIELKICEQI